MKLIFLFTRDRDSSAESFKTEGLYPLFAQMREQGIIENIEVIIDSYWHQGVIEYAPGYICRMVQGIDQALIKPGDVVWVRGGFKPWLPLIDRCRERRNWLLFYGANTGRERWPFWDIIFDDLSGFTRLDGLGRLWMDYRKPMHPEIFKYKNMPIKYDLCIGASYIHDKKGQWRGVKTALAYRDLYGENLHCIMPGAIRHGFKTNHIPDEIRAYDLDITLPGMLSRAELAGVFNQSRVFMHLGSGGQGDRGPMEAMSCGCPVIIGFPRYHAKWIIQAPTTIVPESADNYSEIAALIRQRLEKPADCLGVACHASVAAGIERRSLPMMRRLFLFFARYPEADRSRLEELL